MTAAAVRWVAGPLNGPVSRIARQTVRVSWPAYLGAFVALVSGVVLIATTVNLLASVDATLSRLGPAATEDQRAELDDLTSMLGIMSAVSLFMAVFVVGSTFGFVVATRRRELGLLRLVGATGGQVRRLVLGESLAVAVAAALTGCLIATPLAGPVLAIVRSLGLTHEHLVAPAPWLAWSIAAPIGIVVALLGAWRSSRRAARIPPTAALREAAVDRGRPSVAQWIVGMCCLAGVVATVVVSTVYADRTGPLFALIAAVLLPEVVVIGLMCFGPFVIPRLAGLLASPFVRRDVAARIARDELRADVRTTTSVAAPVIAISAVAGSMLLALSFTADWTAALDRAHLRAQIVVQPGEGRQQQTLARLSADPEVRLVDERHIVPVRIDLGGFEREEVDAVDVPTATEARDLRATRGSIGDLHGRAVAVSRSWTTDAGKGLGDDLAVQIGGEELQLRIVAVVPDAPDLYGDLLLPAELVADQIAASPADDLFVVLHPAADVEAVRTSLTADLPDATVSTAPEWIDAVTAQTRRANNLGLTVLLGPAGFYAAIAIVNATLIGAGQRRRHRRTLALLGASAEQLRRTAIWQAALITGAGLTLGGLTAVLLGLLVRHAIAVDLAGSGVTPAVTVPWFPLLVTILTCGVLAIAAAVGHPRKPARP